MRRIGALAVGLAGTVGLLVPAGGHPAAGASPHTVPLDCSAFGSDMRSTYDASVQPGIIVPDAAGFPYLPVTYTAYGFNKQQNAPEIIGNISTVATTDHLVAAWTNSTDCLGNDDDSRNAWVADADRACHRGE